MSDTIVAAGFGLAGTVVGAVATVLAARIAAGAKPKPEEPGTSTVLGSAVDIRELRILRALYGEPTGRILAAYRDKYYRDSLEATVRKGWVSLIDGKYHMTEKGVAFCKKYLEELLASWKPAVTVKEKD